MLLTHSQKICATIGGKSRVYTELLTISRNSRDYWISISIYLSFVVLYFIPKYSRVYFLKPQKPLRLMSILSHTSDADVGHSWLAFYQNRRCFFFPRVWIPTLITQFKIRFPQSSQYLNKQSTNFFSFNYFFRVFPMLWTILKDKI